MDYLIYNTPKTIRPKRISEIDMNNLKPERRFNAPILVSITLLLVLVAIAIYFNTAKTAPTAFFARSIDDASYDCEKKINDKFGNKLLSKNYDGLSSRFNSQKHQYLIFYRISVQEIVDNYPTIKDYLAKCMVWEKIGYVSDFTILDP